MDTAPSLDTVCEAVNTLYNNPQTIEKEKASQWLEQLQKSVFAWKVADQLLQGKRDLESCYFAAQTMRSKIQKSFHELPLEAHCSLRDSLIEHIGQITEETNTVIVTQLCLALADLALQMSSWKSPVPDLINKFSASNLYALIIIITVLPEEINSRVLRLGANRRKEVIAELSSKSRSVIEFLNISLSNYNGNEQIVIQIMRCLTSWIAVQAINFNDISNNTVVIKACMILTSNDSSSNTHDAATDLICMILQSVHDNNNQHNHLELEMELFNGVIRLEECYHMSVAHENIEKSLNYCRIFTELAESFLDKIINGSADASNPHFALKILDLVLICVGHHDYEVSEVTFNFWYRLAEDVYNLNSRTLNSVFAPYVERLICALRKQCQMDSDFEDLLEEGDDFYDFRVKVRDLVKDIVFIMESSNCFRKMFMLLQAPGETWDSCEAALFIMQAVAKNVVPDESEIAPKVVEAIMNLPENTHIQVRQTSIILLGELCDWIEVHPESLQPVLNFLFYSLQQKGVSSAAATALESICSSCRSHMAVHMAGLIQIVRSMDSFQITNTAAIGLLKGVSVILGRLPNDQLPVAMKEVCAVQATPLSMLVETDVTLSRDTKTDPSLWLDRLAAIFRSANPVVKNNEVHPCLAILTELWPLITKIFDKYQTELRVMERCCRCMRFAIRCIGSQAAVLLEPLVKQMISQYGKYQHTCFLYLGSILVDEFGHDDSCAHGLVEMLESYIQPTFQRLQTPNGLKENPDTVDDFFRLCTRFLQRAPVRFLQSQAIHPILECALSACALDHRDANASVMQFFCDLIFSGRSVTKPHGELRRALVGAVLQQHGQALVANLVYASVFALHSSMLADVANVFLELISSDRAATLAWLALALDALPEHRLGNVAATPQQLRDFQAVFERAEDPKQITIALREFVRLYC